MVNLFNSIDAWGYKRSDSIIKLLYDKYGRNNLYQEITNSSHNHLKNEKEYFKNKLLSKETINFEKIKLLKVDIENIENNIDVEKESIAFIKNCVHSFNLEIFSFILTNFSVLTTAFVYKFKPNWLYFKKFTLFGRIFIFNIFGFNSMVLYNSFQVKKMNAKIIESYKKELAKYNLIFK